MFVGFVAVIIVLLVVVAIMAGNSLSGTDKAQYYAEAEKIRVLVSHFDAEAQFYYASHGESFIGIGSDYFAKVGMAESRYKTDELPVNDWLGLINTENLETVSKGTFCLGGPAGCNLRLFITDVPSDKDAYIIKIIGVDKKNNTTGASTSDSLVDDVDQTYTQILEKTLRKDSNWLGG